MKTSLAGACAIIGHEAIVLSRYKDSVGVWTIGVGHTAAAGPPNPATVSGQMTIEACIDLFRRDLAKYEADVARAFTAPLKQHEFDAAVSFHFNTGAIAQATWVKRFNAGDRTGAIAGIMDWKKPAEIIPRRQAEQKLFSTGVYSGGGMATVYPADQAGRVQWSKGQRVSLAKLMKAEPAAPQPAPSQNPVPAPAAPKGFWASLIEALAKIFAKR